MKFSLSKEAKETLQTINHDAGFHERALLRINIAAQAVLNSELKRVGQQGKKIKNIDLTKGEIEVTAIETAKDVNGPVKQP